MATAEVRQELVPLHAWDTTMPVVWCEDRAYYPLRLLCAVLGVKAQVQLERLREHAALSRLLRPLPVRTRTGVRETWCLERRGIGLWLGSIQVSSLRPEIRPRLLEFQEALVDAADRLWTGETTSVRDVTRFTLLLEARIGRIEERVFTDEAD